MGGPIGACSGPETALSSRIPANLRPVLSNSSQLAPIQGQFLPVESQFRTIRANSSPNMGRIPAKTGQNWLFSPIHDVQERQKPDLGFTARIFYMCSLKVQAFIREAGKRRYPGQA
jgi:hypothetical protein